MAQEKFEFELDDSGEMKEAGSDVALEIIDDEEVVTPDNTEAEVEIEVVDDTPVQDRDKIGKKAPPAGEVTEEELASYSKDVQRRIKHLQRTYHDERREKEEALRERQALIQYVEALTKKLQDSEGNVNKSRQGMLDQAKRAAQVELEQAKAAYKSAYEAGDGGAVTEAMDKLTEARIKFDKIANFKLPAVQSKEIEVKPPVSEPSAPARDTRAEQWRSENPWFGANDPDSVEKTSFALGVHQKLVSSGVDPRTEDYYEKLNTRLRQVFPELTDDDDDTPPAPAAKKSAAVVAPASRSVAPKKITLSQSQIAVANRLGITPLQYAKELAALEKN